MTKSPRWLQTRRRSRQNPVPRSHATSCDSPQMIFKAARIGTRRWRSFALVVASMSACRGEHESTLAQRSAETNAAAAASIPTKADPARDPKLDANAETKVDPPTPGLGERIDLWIDLDPSKPLRILTVGVLTLPLVNRPAGFAREETVKVSECTGVAGARSCTLAHTFDKFEAEPPTGRILEQGEKRFDGVTSTHRIDARGAKVGDATIVGPPGPPNPLHSSEWAETELGKSLVAVHRLACLRLPSEPVAVGAKWSDTCTFFLGGQIARQDAVWELTSISDDPVSGKRAELSMLGKLVVADDDGERSGVIEGKLYFFVDAHAPHIYRARAKVALGTGQKLQTETTVNLQFGHVDEAGVVTRTDGQPMPPPPARPVAPVAAEDGANTPESPATPKDPAAPVVKATPPR